MSHEWFSLAEISERIGRLVWVEERLFEVVGEWSGAEPVHAAAVLFGSTSRHHGWHSQVLRECLPTSVQLREGSPVTAPTSGWQSAIAAMRSFDGEDATTMRLASLVRVVNPWLSRETGALIDVSRPTSDAAAARWLRFVGLDHDDDGSVAAELLDELQANTVSFRGRAAVAELDLR